MVGGIYAHLDDMLASQYQLIDLTQQTACPSSITVGGTFWVLVPCKYTKPYSFQRLNALL